MILQELVRYYERKANDPDTALAPEGFEEKEIPFIIVIDKEGKLVQVEDTRSGDGKKKRSRSFLVPQGVKKTSGVAARSPSFPNASTEAVRTLWESTSISASFATILGVTAFGPSRPNAPAAEMRT